jgi:hypothetical protein
LLLKPVTASSVKQEKDMRKDGNKEDNEDERGKEHRWKKYKMRRMIWNGLRRIKSKRSRSQRPRGLRQEVSSLA